LDEFPVQFDDAPFHASFVEFGQQLDDFHGGFHSRSTRVQPCFF
jgi:hypothetical protein